MTKSPTPEEYYELYDKYISSEKSDKKKEYEDLLKNLSNETNSRDYFAEAPLNRPYCKREELHQKIFKNILDKCQASKRPCIHFLLGSIGSGKTSAKDQILKGEKNKKDFIFINFDDIKKQIPEYDLLKKLNPKKAAAFVQSESAKIASKLFRKTIKKKCNLLFEKNIRKNREGEIHLIREIKDVVKQEYQIFFHIVFLDTYAEAWKRVQKRAEEIKRFVPANEVKETFDNLFPNFNIVQKSLSKKSTFIIYLWYNGSDVKKAKFISGILTGPVVNKYNFKIKKDTDRIKVLLKEAFYINSVVENRFKALPKKVAKDLKQLVFFEDI